MSIEKLKKPYFVGSEEITSAAIEAALVVMQRPDYTYSQVCGELYRSGVSWDNNERAGDRLIQRARKMGLIRYDRGTWRAIPEAWAALLEGTPA